MQYQGNEIYLENGTYWAVPINADGTFDKDGIAEATETPAVILQLVLAESRGDPGDPLYILTDEDDGFIMGLYSHDGELPICEGVGSTFEEAAQDLLDYIIETTNILEGS